MSQMNILSCGLMHRVTFGVLKLRTLWRCFFSNFSKKSLVLP